jgi:hypothetical protein
MALTATSLWLLGVRPSGFAQYLPAYKTQEVDLDDRFHNGPTTKFA